MNVVLSAFTCIDFPYRLLYPVQEKGEEKVTPPCWEADPVTTQWPYTCFCRDNDLHRHSNKRCCHGYSDFCLYSSNGKQDMYRTLICLDNVKIPSVAGIYAKKSILFHNKVRMMIHRL